MAAVSGHLELAQALLEHGATVDVHDSEGSVYFAVLDH